LKNQRQQRPNFSDRIVIVVSSLQQPGVYLAGAQIPISRVPSFPFRFRITEQNAIMKAGDTLLQWTDICQREDLQVSAVVCSPEPRDETNSSKDPIKWSELCLIENKPRTNDEKAMTYPTLRVQGTSKLLRLNSEQLPESPSLVMRMPVSLGLE
jgi:hypothetical protein